MAKDDEGQSGEGGLDLRSLRFGTLNFLRDDSINDSGDRRRGNPLTFLVQSLGKAYGIDTLKDVINFRGIVLKAEKVNKDSIVPINRSEILNAYLNVSLGAKIVAAFTRDKPVYVYKVYIPELEMRPPPVSADDPILDTYFDVYDSRVFPEDDAEIKKGTVVTVVFEDFKNLLNPQIIGAEKKPLIIKGLHKGGSVLEALRNFFGGSPGKGKVGDKENASGSPRNPEEGAPAHSTGTGDAGSPARTFDENPPDQDPDAPVIKKMSASEVEHMAQSEGILMKLYNDPYGYCTIGVGHLIQGRVNGENWKGPCSQAKRHGLIPSKWLKGGLPPDGNNTRAPSETMTRSEVMALFQQDVSIRERWLVSKLRRIGDVRVTQGQFDALLSVVYNSGGGNVSEFIIDPHLAKSPPDFRGAAEAFTVYNRLGYRREDHRRYRAGLNARREREQSMFFT